MSVKELKKQIEKNTFKKHVENEIKEIGCCILSEGTCNIDHLTETFSQYINLKTDDIEEYFDFFDSIAPNGYHFGNHIGDGACYGFFPAE
jgi:hypothetical protein